MTGARRTRQHRAMAGNTREGESSPLWFLPLGLLIVAVVAVPLLVLRADGLPRYRALRTALTELRQDNETLRAEVRALARQTEALKTDLATIERIARDELGMVREGEIVMEF